MDKGSPLFRLPVNLYFVAYALRYERPDTVSFLDTTTGGVLTLHVDPNSERLAEGLDDGICHSFNDHPERFVTLELRNDGRKEKFIVDFADGVHNSDLKGRLRGSAKWENGFSLVEEILSQYTGLYERWKESLSRFLLAEALELVRENFIEPQIIPGAEELRQLRIDEGEGSCDYDESIIH